jgi:hypothetical protein
MFHREEPPEGSPPGDRWACARGKGIAMNNEHDTQEAALMEHIRRSLRECWETTGFGTLTVESERTKGT